MLSRTFKPKFDWKFTNLQIYPADPILTNNALHRVDPNLNKINLTVGAYKDENGRPWVLPSVEASIRQLYINNANYDLEYLPLEGDKEFVNMATDLMFDCSKKGKKLKEAGRVAQVQTLSGTGALFNLLTFYKNCINPNVNVYIPTPTWPFHLTMLKRLNFKIKEISYYDIDERKFNEKNVINQFLKIPPKSLALIQVCGHNPTGYDISINGWKVIIEHFKKNEIDVLLDNPYQGFISGNMKKDGQVIGLFIDSGVNLMMAQSFAKNFGLYSARVGTASIICDSQEIAKKVESNIEFIIRNTTSTLPKFGSELIKNILKSETLKNQWLKDIETMSSRIEKSRNQIYKGMIKRNNSNDWRYIIEQKGMFSLTHLRKEHIKKLKEEKSIYMIDSGRINICGINDDNVNYFCDCLHEVTDCLDIRNN